MIGIAIRFWAGGYVKKDKELATTGPYSYVRNPLYVGNVLIAFGFCLLSGYLWSFAVFAALYAWLYIPSIRKEERTLNKLFGEDFVRYKENVRATWPRLTPYQKGSGGWSGSQWAVLADARHRDACHREKLATGILRSRRPPRWPGSGPPAKERPGPRSCEPGCFVESCDQLRGKIALRHIAARSQNAGQTPGSDPGRDGCPCPPGWRSYRQ